MFNEIFCEIKKKTSFESVRSVWNNCCRIERNVRSGCCFATILQRRKTGGNFMGCYIHCGRSS